MRDVDSPIVEVFRAWTDPGRLTMWLATDSATVTSAVADVRQGGLFRIDGLDHGGALHCIRGTYLAVDAPNRLEMSWRYDGPMVARGGASMVTAEFLALGASSTRLTLTHERVPAARPLPGASFAARIAGIASRLGLTRP